MFLSGRRPGYFHIAPYCHFAEPFPPGVAVAYANDIHPDDELADAAEALRAAEVESVQENDELADTARSDPDEVLQATRLREADLESMSIDEVRTVANALDVPDRSKITEKTELIAEILRRV